MSRERSHAGFTILELMVALTVGGIAISSIYAIGASSTRVFRVQNDVSNSQSALRMAMDQVKRDIARAGYLGTPRADLPGQACGQIAAGLDAPLPGSGRLAAFSRYDNDVQISVANANTAIDPTSANAAKGYGADEVVMFANYATSDEYPILRSVGNVDRVLLQHGFYEFQRDFSDWSTSGMTMFNAGAFQDAFMPGRAVRIHLPSGKYVFDTIAEIIAPTGASPVTLRLVNPIHNDCLSDLNGASISPLSAVRYHVRNAAATGDESPRFAGSGPMARLIRSEVSPINKLTPVQIPGTNPPAFIERSVLDYVVAFQLAFTMSAANLSTGQPDDYEIGATTTDDSLSGGSVNTNPERIRAVTIELAVRTPEQDASFPWDPSVCTSTPPGLCCNYGCFQVFNDRPGASRVRALRAEVFVPNVAMEGW